jgi:hypothetical protein
VTRLPLSVVLVAFIQACTTGEPAPSTPTAPSTPSAASTPTAAAEPTASAAPTTPPTTVASESPNAPPSKDPPLPASIGAATMLPDGTIKLQLRAEGPGGTVGDALLTYPPSDKDYAKILKHLGGLKPGESKPVPPFP